MKQKITELEEEFYFSGINRRCPVCRTDRDTLVRTGETGCPACYTTFRKEIGILTGHPGKADVAAGR